MSQSFIIHTCIDGNNFIELTCPENFIIAIRRQLYGSSFENFCYYNPIKDCLVPFNSKEDCNGVQSCTIQYSSEMLHSCQNSSSSYLRIEYDCIPSKPFKYMHVFYLLITALHNHFIFKFKFSAKFNFCKINV